MSHTCMLTGRRRYIKKCEHNELVVVGESASNQGDFICVKALLEKTTG